MKIPLIPSDTATLSPTHPKPTAIATQTKTPVPSATPTPFKTIPSSPTPTAACSAIHGTTQKITVNDPKLAEPMDLLIYLPPCFSNHQAGGYPVLYLIHGQKETYDQWIRIGVPEIADLFFSSKQIKPYLIIMPQEQNSLEDWPDSSFDTDLVKGVIPWIDAHYPTCSQRVCRAVGGMSRGALWAVELGLSRWQYFGAIGAHSLPGSPFSESLTLKYLNAMKPAGYSRIYLDIGDMDDFFQAQQVFKRYLDKYKIPYEWHLNPGNHTETYWRDHLAEYLSWYGQGFVH